MSLDDTPADAMPTPSARRSDARGSAGGGDGLLYEGLSRFEWRKRAAMELCGVLEQTLDHCGPSAHRDAIVRAFEDEIRALVADDAPDRVLLAALSNTGRLRIVGHAIRLHPACTAMLGTGSGVSERLLRRACDGMIRAIAWRTEMGALACDAALMREIMRRDDPSLHGAAMRGCFDPCADPEGPAPAEEALDPFTLLDPEIALAMIQDCGPRLAPVMSRHLARRARDRSALEEALGMAIAELGNRDIKAIAVLLRAGLDLCGLEDAWGECIWTFGKEDPLMRLVDRSGSAHGRMELHAAEGSIEEMLARPASEPFYGLVVDEMGQVVEARDLHDDEDRE